MVERGDRTRGFRFGNGLDGNRMGESATRLGVPPAQLQVWWASAFLACLCRYVRWSARLKTSLCGGFSPWGPAAFSGSRAARPRRPDGRRCCARLPAAGWVGPARAKASSSPSRVPPSRVSNSEFSRSGISSALAGRMMAPGTSSAIRPRTKRRAGAKPRRTVGQQVRGVQQQAAVARAREHEQFVQRQRRPEDDGVCQVKLPPRGRPGLQAEVRTRGEIRAAEAADQPRRLIRIRVHP
ncbi:hypothetical protein SAMN00790413_01378 [Deinococcus hopiensis KR-140]|uniref:Uncharacterized protein n=1 Tax=Deinococcus hopiensis KR-140 TaxID=695939 RepID=A0A1W1VFG9_9DEIO|nr:hypothetical protein SAMN00790413_01378 [Deinococcus hopiensis KR-140]